MKKLSFLLFVLFLVGGCQNGCNKNQQSQQPPNDNPCQKEIIFQLNWVNDPTFTGEYVAFEKNWKLKKLNVKLNEGGIGIDPISLVASKKADYAVVGADKAIIAISNGAPISIVSVDFQRNPVGWIARPELNVNNISDCSGRKDIELGDKAGTEVSSILKLMLERKKIKIEPASVSFDFSYFISNKNSVYPVYLNEEPIKAREVHGINFVEIDPSKEENGGIELYGNVIIVHNEKLSECPNQVSAVINGLSEGWKDALDNQDEAVEIVMKYVKGEKKYIRGVVDRTLNYVTNMYGKTVPPGHMEKTAWEKTISTLKDAELLKKEIDINKSIKFVK